MNRQKLPLEVFNFISLNLVSSLRVTADIAGTDDEFVCGAKRGYATFNKKSGQLSYIKKFWDDPAMEERLVVENILF